MKYQDALDKFIQTVGRETETFLSQIVDSDCQHNNKAILFNEVLKVTLLLATKDK